MKTHILSEIRRIASENGGVAPGQGLFAKMTGITTAKWRGVHWLRWSDAVIEAGLHANEWNQKFDTDSVLHALAELARRLGRLPTRSEIKMERQLDASFPSHSTVANRYRTNAELNDALLQLSASERDWADLQDILTRREHKSPRVETSWEGFVYLLKSGQHYKIGRSEDIERRFREVRIALPEAVTLIHSIKTDDPPGIEAYWHRRFASKRANGEWFALDGSDVKAFRRRTFQ